MIVPQIRLQWSDIYPAVDMVSVQECLAQISGETLINFVGFLSTKIENDFLGLFTNQEVQDYYNKQVAEFMAKANLRTVPALISREGKLKIAELILSNKEVLFNNQVGKEDRTDTDELNMFKTFLIVNQEINDKYKPVNDEVETSIDKITDLVITTSFSTSDFTQEETDTPAFAKLLYSTIVKFEYIIEFLKMENNNYLGDGLCDYFKVSDLDGLTYQFKHLCAVLLDLKSKNGFIIQEIDKDKRRFLSSLTGEVEEISDYTSLRNFPLYEIDENSYGVVDFFMVLDKFVLSTKFILKKVFDTKNELKPNSSEFFSVFNKIYSEDVLMNGVLNEIFNKKYFIKKDTNEIKDNEPDYYIRHNNRVFLFENKDTLVRGDIKSSFDIDLIDKTLKKKFLNDGRDVGIGQLVNTIVRIVNNSFEFDDYVNTRFNLKIYPILLVHNRAFMTDGLNYKLNQWYRNLVKVKLGKGYDERYIKDLCIIDIDTLIYWKPYLKANDVNFRKVLDKHLKIMDRSLNIMANRYSQNEILLKINKNFSDRLTPMSDRLNDYQLPIELVLSKFEGVLDEV
ncbi:MAG: hypothetical protein ACI9N1_000444 [Flavobacteriales bacterium]|jgi:hypothetical protein